MWVCSICTVHNDDMSATHCMTCESPRSKVPPVQPLVGSDRRGNQSNLKDGRSADTGSSYHHENLYNQFENLRANKPSSSNTRNATAFIPSAHKGTAGSKKCTLSLQLMDEEGNVVIDSFEQGQLMELSSIIQRLLVEKDLVDRDILARLAKIRLDESSSGNGADRPDGRSAGNMRGSRGRGRGGRGPGRQIDGSHSYPESSAPSGVHYDPNSGGFRSNNGGHMDNVYNETMANAGAAGGERSIPGVDNSLTNGSGRVRSEKITLGDRNSQIISEKIHSISRPDPHMSLSDGGGSRVNQNNIRKYDLGGYENSVLINKDRHNIHNTQVQNEDVQVNGDLAESSGVPFEVAGVRGKIANLHRIGGERVKEMDHFVAEVSTPVVEVLLKDKDDNMVVAAKHNDVGVHVISATKDSLLQQSNAVPVMYSHGRHKDGSQGRTFEAQVLIEPQYMTRSDISIITQYSSIVLSLLSQTLAILQFMPSAVPIQCYYMTTLRTDELVCSISKRDSKLYVNVMAFQQQLWCNEEVNTGISGSGGTGGTTVTLKNDRKKEVLAYYITRVSSAIRVVLEDGTSNTLPGWLRGNREASKGLYSNHIRAAFKAHC